MVFGKVLVGELMTREAVANPDETGVEGRCSFVVVAERK